MLHDAGLEVGPSFIPELGPSEGNGLSELRLVLLAEVGLADELVSYELLEDALVNWNVIQDLVCLDSVNKIRLLIVELGEDDVEYNVLETVDLLFCVLLDAGSVIDLSEVAADLEVVPLVLTQLDHVTIKLQLELGVLGVLEESG